MADRHAAKDAMQQLWICHDEVRKATEAEAFGKVTTDVALNIFGKALSSGPPAMRLVGLD